MDKTNAETLALARKLIDLGEEGLAKQIVITNLQTHLIALRGAHLMKKHRKLQSQLRAHQRRVEKHAHKIDMLADITQIILTH